jgi:hypothetical protein
MMPIDDLIVIEDEEIESPWPCNDFMENAKLSPSIMASLASLRLT